LIVAFINEMRAEGHAVESVCRVLREQGCQVAARTYRAWSRPAQPVSARTISDAIVTDTVRDMAWTVDESGCRRLTPEGLYGRRKMIPLVRRSIPEATPGAVDRAMRSLGLQGVRRSKGIRTTIPAKDGRRAGDLLNRDFTAPAPNRTWVMDFTYVRAWTGFVYVAFEYTSIRFTEHLALEGVRPSIGSVGDAYDNALMECVIGLFKTECIRTTVFHAGAYRTVSDVEYATAGWVDWYNNRRLHSTLDYLTPIEFEQAHYATLNREPQPA